MTKLSFNLHKPLSLLEQKKNCRYSYAAIADGSGLTRQGVRRLLKEKSDRVDLSTLGKLLDFFSAEGMPITVGDLFAVTPNAKS
jgi:hypothetical protein